MDLLVQVIFVPQFAEIHLEEETVQNKEERLELNC